MSRWNLQGRGQSSALGRLATCPGAHRTRGLGWKSSRERWALSVCRSGRHPCLLPGSSPGSAWAPSCPACLFRRLLQVSRAAATSDGWPTGSPRIQTSGPRVLVAANKTQLDLQRLSCALGGLAGHVAWVLGHCPSLLSSCHGHGAHPQRPSVISTIF